LPTQSTKKKSLKKTLHPFKSVESFLSQSDYQYFIGIDEVGAGCLAGSLNCAAFLLDLSEDWIHSEIPRCYDSKKLNISEKTDFVSFVKNKKLKHAVVEITPKEIDHLNIYQSRMEGMYRAYKKLVASAEGALNLKKTLVLIDGPVKPKQFQVESVELHAESRGDQKYFPIAAASILAKTERDKVMKNLSEDFPQYSWETNVGYPTPAHKKAIQEHGITPYHRRSFRCN